MSDERRAFLIDRLREGWERGNSVQPSGGGEIDELDILLQVKEMLNHKREGVCVLIAQACVERRHNGMPTTLSIWVENKTHDLWHSFEPAVTYSAYWWEFDDEGMAQRRAVLEEAIASARELRERRKVQS